MAQESTLDEVVSTDTETSQDESSTSDTQTGSDQSQPQRNTDWRRTQREDPDLNNHIQSEIAKARTRWQRQQLREQAKAAAESPDPNHARYVAAQVAQEQDEPDEAEAHDANWAQAADRVQPQLEHLLQVDKDGRAHNPYYVALHQREGRAAMDKRYASDPVGFVAWVEDQILDMRVNEKVNKVSPGLAAAQSQDAAHARLRNQAVPIGGSAGGGGALTVDRYHNMTFEERQALRKSNPRAIDDMIARASRGR